MSPYHKLVVYYFSGTGNSQNVARWFSAIASQQNIECSILNISNIDRHSIAVPPADALLVFISPVHGFNYPPVMLHFIARFPKARNKVLLMNTRAGMLIGRWNVPGLSGVTFYLSALLLKLKRYSIVGMKPVDLPSNWLSVHPGLNARTVNFLHVKNKDRVEKCAEKVLAGKTDFGALREIIQDLIIAPISLGYYFMGRFMFAKSYYASMDCTNCDICVKNCPVKAIVKIDNRPFWTFNCESCMRCMSNCPTKAIETAHGFLIGYLLFSSSVSTICLTYLNTVFNGFGSGFTGLIIEMLLFLLFLGIFYRVIHYLMRFRWIERLMVYSSLTKYKFWGRRYKALKEI